MSANLEFRAGTLADWPSVARIVAQTWNGHDYIDGKTWRAWLMSGAGPVVAVDTGQIVGFSRLAMLGEGEWWLESPRVIPGSYGDVADALFARMLAEFRTHGAGLLRMTTFSRDEPTSRVARNNRFMQILSYSPVEFYADSSAGFGSFGRLGPAQFDLVSNYLRYSPMHRVNRFMDDNWVFYYINDDRLHGLLSDPEVDVIGWRDLDQLLGVAVVSGHAFGTKVLSDTLNIAYLDATEDTTLRAMLNALRGLTARRGKARAVWKMPLSIGVERQLADYPMFAPWDGAVWLFERPIQAPSTP